MTCHIPVSRTLDEDWIAGILSKIMSADIMYLTSLFRAFYVVHASRNFRRASKRVKCSDAHNLWQRNFEYE
jgi:hypothetical protein